MTVPSTVSIGKKLTDNRLAGQCRQGDKCNKFLSCWSYNNLYFGALFNKSSNEYSRFVGGYASGYTYKTMTKNGSQMYYNLSSMDISQIPKSIWRDGIQLKLMDVQWIGDNRSASADTAVGNNFAAKGTYQGTYQVNIPSGYIAEVLYKGTVEKEISEQTAYKVTYVGEEVDTGFFDNVSVPYLIGFFLFDAVVIVMAVFLVKKLRKKNQEADEEEEQENDDEKEGGTGEN